MYPALLEKTVKSQFKIEFTEIPQAKIAKIGLSKYIKKPSGKNIMQIGKEAEPPWIKFC